MNYQSFRDEHARLSVLRALKESAGYASNSAVLRDELERFALRLSRDQMASVLAWLAEQGLVALETMGTVQIATITRRGLDVAEGTAVVPGVRRPSPEV